jgi:hypothetical protein
MNHIIVGFSTPRKNKLLPWLIRKAEKTPFSHVYVKIYDERINRYMVYEAAGLIVHCSTQDTFYRKNIPIAEHTITCSMDDRMAVLTAASDALALPYGMNQLIGLALVRLCRMLGKRIKNPFRDGRLTYVCSEFGGLILHILGYKVRDLDELTPRDIYEILNGQTI